MARLKDNDAGWIKQSFILPEKSISDQDMYSRVISTADFKFTDTTVGGNFAINPPPQFTRYADMKVGGLSWGDQSFAYGSRDSYFGGRLTPGANADLSGNNSHAMGRYYSEAIDDHAQVVTMRFGVPEFNSLLMFFGTFYQHSAAVTARSGRGTSLAMAAGKVTGAVVALPFQPLIFGLQVYRFLSKSPPSKFYYLKPTMPLYWNAVNTMANGIAVNMGLIPPQHTAAQTEVMHKMQPFDGNRVGNTGVGRGADNVDYGMYNRLLPGIYKPSGGLDLYSVATRAQRLANNKNAQMAKNLDQAGTSMAAMRDMVRKIRQEYRAGPAMTAVSGFGGIDKYIGKWFGLQENTITGNDSEDVAFIGDRRQYDNEGGGGNDQILDLSGKKTAGAVASFSEFFRGELLDGASFVNFRVDFTGDSSESFSNSARESELAGKINSMSSSTRETRFSFADGNIGDGLITGAVEAVVGAAKDFAMGVADGLQISGLAALAGNAFVDIPKHWDSSTFDGPRADFTIQLRSPYGNKISRFQNLYIPLSMLLAAALPISTGKHSYTSPFICELYCKGRNSIRLGIIDRLSITRGVGNVGWTPEGEPLGIDISFSVLDLSTALHMPLAANFSLWNNIAQAASAQTDSEAAKFFLEASVKDMYDDDNSYTDYLAVLGSLNFNDQVYPTNQWKLRRIRNRLAFESWRSPAHMANWFIGTFPGRVMNAIAVNTDRTN